jgi:RNA polymerase sigma factor (TIGR02999 family)
MPVPPADDSTTPPKDQATRHLLDMEGAGAKTKDKKVGGMGKEAADRLLELVYDDCKRLAASYLKRENAGHTLQPTALAHEVYLRLIEQERVDWKGRTHFLAIAAQAMRRLLIDHARGRDRQKRGGGWKRVSLGGGSSTGPMIADPNSGPRESDVDIEKLNEVLAELAELDERQARVVEMRYLGGMTVEEVAEALSVSKRTVEGDWTMARAWLRKRLAEENVD